VNDELVWELRAPWAADLITDERAAQAGVSNRRPVDAGRDGRPDQGRPQADVPLAGSRLDATLQLTDRFR